MGGLVTTLFRPRQMLTTRNAPWERPLTAAITDIHRPYHDYNVRVSSSFM